MQRGYDLMRTLNIVRKVDNMAKSKRLRKLEKQLKLKSQRELLSTEQSKIQSKTKPKRTQQKQTSVSTKKAKQIQIKSAKRKARESKKYKESPRDRYYRNAGRTKSEKGVAFKRVVLDNLYSIINRAISESAGSNTYKDEKISAHANKLKSLLDEQISLYGEQKVAMACESAPEQAISSCETYIYASDQKDKNLVETAFTEFVMIITGEVLTPEQAKWVSEQSDIENPFIKPE